MAVLRSPGNIHLLLAQQTLWTKAFDARSPDPQMSSHDANQQQQLQKIIAPPTERMKRLKVVLDDAQIREIHSPIRTGPNGAKNFRGFTASGCSTRKWPPADAFDYISGHERLM